MRLDEMFIDYCRKVNAKHTPAQIAHIALNNHIIANENGFVVFAWVLDEFHALFAYAAPGKSFDTVNANLEDMAKENGVKRIKFSTDKPALMMRKFKGYKPIATILSKELI